MNVAIGSTIVTCAAIIMGLVFTVGLIDGYRIFGILMLAGGILSIPGTLTVLRISRERAPDPSSTQEGSQPASSSNEGDVPPPPRA
jgi:hypothetical protein